MRAPFGERYERALADKNVRIGLGNFQEAWRVSRDSAIDDLVSTTGRSFDELRAELADFKRAARRSPETLAAFRMNAEASGATLVDASTMRDAVDAVAEICRRHHVTLMVKGKSMVSEELNLNAELAEVGVTAVETDLGEWLLQLANDHPSHLVMPIIHRRRHQIAELLSASLGRPFDADDIPAMVQAARTELRQSFAGAQAGLSGANALVASTGAIMLVTNEGNNRLSTSLPPVHIIVAGRDKLVADTSQAMAQLRLLARSATGQTLTSYSTFITGPSSHQHQYIVLVDNGRSEMARDDVFESALGCIRCGACANVCPPYSIVGGHAFGHVYTGAIGLVNTAFHHGVDAIAGPQSLCVSCNACTAACPAGIPLGEQILHIRSKVATSSGGSSRLRRTALRLFANRRLFALGTSVAGMLGRPVAEGGQLRLTRPTRHLGWRRAPLPAVRPARSRLARTQNHGASAADVSLFLQCLADRVAPHIATASAQLLEATGATIDVPTRQHCCGLPALDAGERDLVRAMAKQTIETFANARAVVTPAASCAIAIRYEYPTLFDDNSEWRHRAEQLATRTYDLVTYLSAHVDELKPKTRPLEESTTVHRFCQSTNVAGLGSSMDDLVSGLGLRVEPLADADVCCGFGGGTSINAPEVSHAILSKKLDAVDASGADILVTDNPGCVLHLRGGAAAANCDIEVLHLAELLARALGRA